MTEDLRIEFTSGLFSYGRLIRTFGDSVLSIKRLGLIANLLKVN